jgi:hypothetical protein
MHYSVIYAYSPTTPHTRMRSDLEQGKIVVCTNKKITTYTCTIFRHFKKLTILLLLFHPHYIEFIYVILTKISKILHY